MTIVTGGDSVCSTLCVEKQSIPTKGRRNISGECVCEIFMKLCAMVPLMTTAGYIPLGVTFCVMVLMLSAQCIEAFVNGENL